MRTPPCRTILAASLLLFAVAGAATFNSSQKNSSDRPSYAVASVKPNHSTTEIPGPWAETEDYFAWKGRTLRTLIQTAYRVRGWQVKGGPAWMNTDLWDVEARSKSENVGATPDPRDQSARHDRHMLMLQSLLEDSFKLEIQRQTRQSPIYNLVVAEGGPKIKLDGDPSAPRPEPGSSSSYELSRGTIRVTPFSMEGRAIPLDVFVRMLLSRSGRPVVDHTNLKGLYDLRIRWSPETSGQVDPTVRPSSRASLVGDFEPSFFTALREQLGLKLDSATGPVEFIVILSAQKPSGN